ncbi:hypothetical protein [Merismopedia glauca]|uniref:Uncharacterized protein n=1 Tax=Merismopedia glauca CCAP 1448/3 TaxID=1296344 RepID=A0A2T1BXM3_9CYAN|nr:hypothetical protein [Merismopedia glauca]PSB00674.1 hypothetical protein C7B64_22270 [Merismopedia glauca CCAP 1448/3]
MVQAKVHYSRVKRWQNMHGREFNKDGTLKPEVRTEKLNSGRSSASIDDYEARIKQKFEEWKRLDETDPEPWINYSADEVIFTPEDRRMFDESGSLRPEYFAQALAIGARESFLRAEEAKMKNRIAEYERMSQEKEKIGINFGEQQLKSRQNAARTYPERAQQMIQDIRNGEDEDSLPFDRDWFFKGV